MITVPLVIVGRELVLLAYVHCQDYFFIKLLLAKWALKVLLWMTAQQMLYRFEQLP
jgi:hypothetical protein